MAEAKPDTRTEPADHTPWGMLGSISLWLAIALCLYVLSVGPLVKICPQPPAALRLMYAPLAYLYHHSEPVRSFYTWYGKVWGVKI